MEYKLKKSGLMRLKIFQLCVVNYYISAVFSESNGSSEKNIYKLFLNNRVVYDTTITLHFCKVFFKDDSASLQ